MTKEQYVFELNTMLTRITLIGKIEAEMARFAKREREGLIPEGYDCTPDWNALRGKLNDNERDMFDQMNNAQNGGPK